MNNKLRIKRLKQLRHLVKNWSRIFKGKITFNMQMYYHDPRISGHWRNARKKPSACALGGAAMYKPFIKQGLKLSDELPAYKRSLCFDAAQRFFGLDEVETRVIFSSLNSISRKQVLATIDDAIQRHK